MARFYAALKGWYSDRELQSKLFAALDSKVYLV
jgi:hypothetical protein